MRRTIYVILSKYNQNCLFSHVLHVEQFCISTVYIIRMSFSASNHFIIVGTVVVPRVCVPVRSFFLPPRASRSRCTCSPRHRKLFYIYYNRDFC